MNIYKNIFPGGSTNTRPIGFVQPGSPGHASSDGNSHSSQSKWKKLDDGKLENLFDLKELLLLFFREFIISFYANLFEHFRKSESMGYTLL